MNMIPTPTISEIMREEFMKPLDIDIFTLAENTGLPVHELREILADQRDIDLTVSQKLGAFFGISDTFFLNVQRDIKARNYIPELQYA